MKALVGIAVVLGLAGTVLGAIALIDNEPFDKKTLNLTSGKDKRVNFRTPGVKKGHPLGSTAWSVEADVSGDRTGERVVTCIPFAAEEIVCDGAYRLSDGNIEYESSQQVTKGQATATATVTGGTGAYEGATGSVDLNFRKNIYKVHLLIPKQ